jgi:hypothetical protein
VAELERKIDALTATLAQRDGGAQYDPSYQVEIKRHPTDSASPYAQSSPQYQADQRLLGNHEHGSPTIPRQVISRPSEGPDKRRRLERIETKRSTSDDQMRSGNGNGRGASIYDQEKPEVFDHSDLDKKIEDIIDSATAERLFNRYVTHVAPRFPAVPFPLGTNAKVVRKEKPILFLAILSSTCFGTGVPDHTQGALEAELRDVFATSMWKRGEKSLELIQALHVSTLWYRPPANFEQHMFYQMVHMSAVMAIDIGIGKKQSPWKKQWYGQEQPFKRVRPNPECAESRRAWIVCYFLCISITMVLRRPILVRYNEYMRECVEYLETADDALPSDKILCHHVKLAYVSEDIATRFMMDDPTHNLSISDGKVTYSIKHFEKDLAKLRTADVSDHAIQLADQVTNLYLHEIALHSQSNAADFKQPFTEETFKTAVGESVLGTQHVDALTACQQSCQDILDTFLSYEFDVIYALPVIFCESPKSIVLLTLLTPTAVRVLYAAVVIIKLYIAATAPGEISAIIKVEELKVEQHLEQLEHVFKTIMERDKLSPHSKFLWVIQRLIDRYNGIKSGRTGRSTPPSARDMKPPVNPAAPAQGLHLLSEVAMSGNQNNSNGSGNGNPQIPRSHQGQPPPPGWYPQQQQPNDMSNLPMDPAAYAYPTSAPVAGYDVFDYGTGSLGMGMDGAISGLFMADGLWNFNEPQGQGFPGWS